MESKPLILEDAIAAARRAHAGKFWNNGQPYEVHLERVASCVRLMCPGDLDMEIAAWLHDSVEDTTMTLDQIEDGFGSRVRMLVWAVTDELGKNLAERHIKTYPKIRNVQGAIYLKLADRLVNVRASAEDRGGYFDMYRKEHPEFRAALYTPGVAEDWWAELDDLLMDDPLKESIKLRDQIMCTVTGPYPIVSSAVLRVVDKFLRERLQKEAEQPKGEK
jgi:hypothetical protein